MAGATSLVELILKKWGAPAAGVAAAGQSDDADAGFITKGGKTLLEAWHGSPHKFDKFSMDAIGTGEGAQAYGHGLYFADSDDVALHYSGGFDDRFTLDGKPYVYPDYMPVELDPDAYDLAVQNTGRYGKEGAIEKGALLGNKGYSDEWIASYSKYVDEVGDRVGFSKTPKGALYRTEIDVTPESLLDWDKPLSEQSEAVREALQNESLISVLEDGMSVAPGARLRIDDEIEEFPKYFMETDSGSKFRLSESDLKNLVAQKESEISGRTIANAIATKAGGQREASRYLNDKGIKGIKYLDGDSRAVGDGTSNYVIFDDSLINIAERGNATVPMLGLLATGSVGAGVLLNSLFEEAERAKK